MPGVERQDAIELVNLTDGDQSNVMHLFANGRRGIRKRLPRGVDVGGIRQKRKQSFEFIGFRY
jgi:hypothetical protein